MFHFMVQVLFCFILMNLFLFGLSKTETGGKTSPQNWVTSTGGCQICQNGLSCHINPFGNLIFYDIFYAFPNMPSKAGKELFLEQILLSDLRSETFELKTKTKIRPICLMVCEAFWFQKVW